MRYSSIYPLGVLLASGLLTTVTGAPHGAKRLAQTDELVVIPIDDPAAPLGGGGSIADEITPVPLDPAVPPQVLAKAKRAAQSAGQADLSQPGSVDDQFGVTSTNSDPVAPEAPPQDSVAPVAGSEPVKRDAEPDFFDGIGKFIDDVKSVVAPEDESEDKPED